MKASLYKDTNYALSHLIEEIKHGKIGVPELQRPFVWTPAKVRDLFDSMYQGFPVGTLMFWETDAEVGMRQIGGNTDGKVASQVIVDGQQRLTSLYSVLTGHEVLNHRFAKRRIRMAFCPAEETFEVTDAAIEKNAEYLPDITALWGGRYKSVVREFLQKLGKSRGEDLPHEEQDSLEDRIDNVRDLRDFRFQTIVIGSGANEEQVAEIFVRVNSQGIKLRQSDFILTLMSVHWEEGRREIEKFCRSAVDPAVKGPSARNVFLDPEPAQLVRAGVGLAFRRGSLGSVYNILRGKDLATGDVSAQRRDEQFAKLTEAQEDVLNLTNWHEYLKCLTLAGFRSRRMIAAETAIVYTYILWLIGKRDYGLDYATLRGVISRWFFMAHTTNRYTGAAESQIEFDMRLLEGIEPGNGEAFCTKLDSIVKTHLTPDYWSTSLPNRLDTSAAKSPPLCAYWAALNLLDAELLFSKLRVHDLFGDPAPKTIERHHLFPKNHLAGEGITTRREVNAIANMAFLDWSENATISDADPADYWPRMTEKLDPATLEKQMYWHALPRGWETMPYQEFLTERRKLIAEVTRDGFRHLSDDRDADTTADTDPSTAELFAAGESQTVELKSTARWNLIAGIKDDKISHMVLKTVCGFLNVEGGTLVIGVDDDGKVVGLDHDYSTFSGKPNRDGFELWLWDYLEVNTSHPIAGVLHVEFSNPDGAGDVCIIRVAAARKPVFAKPQSGGGDPSEFWVRIGNATKQLYGDDMTTYQKDHWG